MYTKRLSIYLSLLSCLLLVYACRIPEAYGDLTVLVLDNQGNRIEDASVVLYLTEEDYNQEINPYQETLLTDDDGELTYFNLMETSLYVDVVKDSLNNVEGVRQAELTITSNGFNNEIIVVVQDSRSGILADADGREWRWGRVLANNADITDDIDECSLNDRYRFFKGGQLELDDGASRCDSLAPEVLERAWGFNQQQTQLLFIDPNDSTQVTRLGVVAIRRGLFRVIFNDEIQIDGVNSFLQLDITFIRTEEE